MRLSQKHRHLIRIILTVLVVASAYFANNQYNKPDHSGNNHSTQERSEQVDAPKTTGGTDHRDESARLVEAHARRQSKVWMTVKAKVVKRLRDDNKGHRHQQFLAKPTQGPTLKIAHNIDLAPYVPLREGDTVWMRGRYEWNAKGGVLHWTHHDPRKPNRQDPKEGWIELNGKRYD